MEGSSISYCSVGALNAIICSQQLLSIAESWFNILLRLLHPGRKQCLTSHKSSMMGTDDLLEGKVLREQKEAHKAGIGLSTHKFCLLWQNLKAQDLLMLS